MRPVARRYTVTGLNSCSISPPPRDSTNAGLMARDPRPPSDAGHAQSLAATPPSPQGNPAPVHASPCADFLPSALLILALLGRKNQRAIAPIVNLFGHPFACHAHI